MKQPAMVDQVDRIIRNTLLLRREIFLPEVGSLYIAHCGAMRHKQRLTPSCQRVCFTSHERGESLIAILAREIDGDTAQAADIYHRWLGYARHDNRLTVGCCGVLHHKHFSMNGDFDALLNPFGRGSMELIPRRRPALWVAATATVLLLAGAGYVGYTHFAADATATHTTPTNAIAANTAAADPTATSETATDATAADAMAADLETERPAAAAATAEIEAQPTQQPADEQATAKERVTPKSTAAEAMASASKPAHSQPQVVGGASDRLVSGRSYVVLGVFSTEANARRAVGGLTAGTEIEARIYRYGAKWMVSIYESDNRDACLDFIRSKSAQHPDLWPYTAK